MVAVRKTLVYGDVVNTDYEGDIATQGDSVKIISVGRPTVRKYTGADITFEEISTADQTLRITEADYVALVIDDVDKRQAVPGLMEQAANESAYALRVEADRFIASKYTEVAAANNIGTVTVTTADAARDLMTDLMVTLDNADVSPDGRFAVVPPWFHGLLTDVKEFIALPTGTAGSDALLNGRVGRLKNFDIRMATNTPNPTGDDNVIMAGTRAAISFATQIPLDSVEFLRPEKLFKDAMKCLHLYGAKVVRPDHLAVATVSPT